MRSPLPTIDFNKTPNAAEKADDLNAGVEHGHYSSALCHLANISYRLGERVPFNGKTLGDNREVVETFNNLQENLRVVGVRLEQTSYQLGRTLTIDRAGERFIGEGAQAANQMRTRQYRQPFVLPEKV